VLYGNETIAIEVKNSSRWQERDLIGIKAYLGSTKKMPRRNFGL